MRKAYSMVQIQADTGLRGATMTTGGGDWEKCRRNTKDSELHIKRELQKTWEPTLKRVKIMWNLKQHKEQQWVQSKTKERDTEMRMIKIKQKKFYRRVQRLDRGIEFIPVETYRNNSEMKDSARLVEEARTSTAQLNVAKAGRSN